MRWEFIWGICHKMTVKNRTVFSGGAAAVGAVFRVGEWAPQLSRPAECGRSPPHGSESGPGPPAGLHPLPDHLHREEHPKERLLPQLRQGKNDFSIKTDITDACRFSDGHVVLFCAGMLPVVPLSSHPRPHVCDLQRASEGKGLNSRTKTTTVFAIEDNSFMFTEFKCSVLTFCPPLATKFTPVFLLCRWWPWGWSSASPSPWSSSTSSSCLALFTGRCPLCPQSPCPSPCPERTTGRATEHVHPHNFPNNDYHELRVDVPWCCDAPPQKKCAQTLQGLIFFAVNCFLGELL